MTVTPEHSSTTYYIPLEVRLSQGSPAAHICHELVVGVFLRGVVFHDAGLSLSCQAHYMLVCNVRALSVVGRRVSVFTNCSVETIPPFFDKQTAPREQLTTGHCLQVGQETEHSNCRQTLYTLVSEVTFSYLFCVLLEAT